MCFLVSTFRPASHLAFFWVLGRVYRIIFMCAHVCLSVIFVQMFLKTPRQSLGGFVICKVLSICVVNICKVNHSKSKTKKKTKKIEKVLCNRVLSIHIYTCVCMCCRRSFKLYLYKSFILNLHIWICKYIIDMVCDCLVYRKQKTQMIKIL